MNSEEKILAILEKHSEMLALLREEQKQMRDDLSHIKSRLGVVESVQIKMQDDLTHIKARLDYDVDKRLGAVNEGIDAVQETVVPKSRVERLEDDVVILKTAVKMLTQEVSELKKAQ